MKLSATIRMKPGDNKIQHTRSTMNMSTTKNVLLEFALVTVIGSALGLAANAMYRDGISLQRDYFPKNEVVIESQASPATGPIPISQEDEFNPKFLDTVAEYLQKQGFQVIRHDDVVALFNDPLSMEGYNIFVDARDDHGYQQGHIPGAYQLDHYRIERYIDEVMEAAQLALKIVIYCNGGECEDSEFALNELLQRGIDPAKMFIYPGGIGLWEHCELPIEKGERLSNNITGQFSSESTDELLNATTTGEPHE